MADSGDVGFQMDRIGHALRSAATERGIQLTLLAANDLPLAGPFGTEIRLDDGRVCGTLSVPGEAPTEDDGVVMATLASALAHHIEQTRYLSPDRLGSRIRHVIDAGLVRVVLQPIQELSSRHTVGLEALARFPADPELGPSDWFAEAETVGLGRELELAALKVALETMHEIEDDRYLSVNVSPETVATDHFAALVDEIALERLVIEITEHSPVRDYSALRRTIDGFRSRGARLAIDDAGAGFASLNHVVALEPDVIKLDIGLIRNIDRDATKKSLVRSLAAFAREVRASVIAEGIETEAEFGALSRIGIDYGQGFLIARPSPAASARVAAPIAQPSASAIAGAVEEHLLESLASELGLPAEEVRSLSPESRSRLWRRLAFDALTGALQRTHGVIALDREIARARRRGEPLTLLFMDVDKLKVVNDRDGHQAGDHLLQTFARAAANCLRREDILFRYGGDEFVCVFPSTSPREADPVIARLRAAMAPYRISFSAGLAEFQEGETLEVLLRRADAAMYADKRSRQSTECQ